MPSFQKQRLSSPAGAWLGENSINKQFDEQLAFLEDGLQRVEKHVTPFNASMRSAITTKLAQRIDAAKKTRKSRRA
jgi:hypothetical protein